MGRNIKRGLDYFPFYVDFFQDLKVRKLRREKGVNSISVYTLLLCIIYKNGYFIKLNDELSFFISEQTGLEEEYINSVINCCLKFGLFSNELYLSDKVLTSEDIQSQYRDTCVSQRRKVSFPEFRLISSEEIGISSEEIGISSEEKKKKENEKKSNTKEKINKKEKKESISKDIPKKENLSLTAAEENQKEKIDFTGIQNLFNSTLGGILPRIQAMTEARKKAVRARITQHGVEAIPKVFEQVLNSQFLRGNNDRNWTPNFDWIFNSTNFTRILEGNYNIKYQQRYGYSQYDAAKQRERETDEAFLRYAAEAFGKKTDDIAKIR